MIKGGRSQVLLCLRTYVSRLGRLSETGLMPLVMASGAASLKMEVFGRQEIRPAEPASPAHRLVAKLLLHLFHLLAATPGNDALPTKSPSSMIWLIIDLEFHKLNPRFGKTIKYSLCPVCENTLQSCARKLNE